MTRPYRKYTDKEKQHLMLSRIDNFMEIHERFYEVLFDHPELERFDEEIMKGIRTETVKEQRRFYLRKDGLPSLTYKQLKSEVDELISNVDHIAKNLANALDNPESIPVMPQQNTVMDSRQDARA